VAPSSYIYSHFKHVSGIPAPDGVQGETINKHTTHDVLNDQLTHIKKRPEYAYNPASASDKQIDALIEQYENQIRQAKAASEAMPYKPSPTAPTGAIFNLVA
jgi:hypothetical protein